MNKKSDEQSSEENPVINSGKFESQRSNKQDDVLVLSPINKIAQGADPAAGDLKTIEQKPLSTFDFLEGLKQNTF